jgi:hypothetical protein
MLAVLAGFAIAVAVIACGGPMASKPAEPRSVEHLGSGQTMPPGDARAEIERLSAEIEQSLGQGAIPAPEPFSASSMDPDPRGVTAIKSVCTPPERPTAGCADICKIGTHICDNADRICTLADELQPDDWSKGKCEDGKRSCEAGRKKCCECL